MAKSKGDKNVSAKTLGFRKVENSISGFWKPEDKGATLQGIVGGAVEIRGRDGDNRFFPIALTSADGGPIVNSDEEEIEPREGLIVGVGGKMLFQFLAAREGKEVLLVYQGLGKPKPGQNPPKMFDTFERE